MSLAGAAPAAELQASRWLREVDRALSSHRRAARQGKTQVEAAALLSAYLRWGLNLSRALGDFHYKANEVWV